jgi:electron transfer flavoprotein beta subunit
MKAMKKLIEELTAGDSGVHLTPLFKTLKVSEPPKCMGGGEVENVDEPVARLEDAGFTAGC